MGPSQFTEGDRVGVLTTQPLDRVLDYRAPEGGCSVGDFVEVPLGPRRVLGVVWGPGEGSFDYAKIRAVARVLDVPPMRAELQQFLERAGDYTITPLSAMLSLSMRVPGLGAPPATRRVYQRGPETPARMTDARKRVLDALKDYGGAPVTQHDLIEAASVSSAVVKGLEKAGALVALAAPRDQPYPRLDPDLPGKPLTPEQATATEALLQGVKAGEYGTTLLQGVTGSGKTEVYLEAVAACLRSGRQALVLLPEIALTAEFLARVEARFGARPAEWHSGVTVTERRRCWRMVAENAAQIVVGARSALFLPFRDLGLIVVDEEHDSSYKQEDGVHYSARDMAVLRASLASAQVVLASATPSLESWSNAEAGKYSHLKLPSRFGTSALPEMRAIDMRVEDLPSGQWVSPTLASAVAASLQAGEQAMLFLNRRGYAPVTLCRACGQQIACHQCDARMVEHRFQKRLVCHQCGETRPIPDACPSCEVEGKLAAVGPGVERLAEEAAAKFPEARIAVLSSDLFGSARALKAQVEALAQGEADLIIPAAAARPVARSPEAMAVLATVAGALSALVGLAVSFRFDTPTGPTIVCTAAVLFLTTTLFRVLSGDKG